MQVRFSVCDAGIRVFVVDVPDAVMAAYLALPDSHRQRIAWWREALGDDRIAGRSLVWEPVAIPLAAA